MNSDFLYFEHAFSIHSFFTGHCDSATRYSTVRAQWSVVSTLGTYRSAGWSVGDKLVCHFYGRTSICRMDQNGFSRRRRKKRLVRIIEAFDLFSICLWPPKYPNGAASVCFFRASYITWLIHFLASRPAEKKAEGEKSALKGSFLRLLRPAFKSPFSE